MFAASEDNGTEVIVAPQAVPPRAPSDDDRKSLHELKIVSATASPIPVSVRTGRGMRVTVNLQLTNNTTGKKLTERAYTFDKIQEDATANVERTYWDAEKTKLRSEFQYIMDRNYKIREGFERRYYESGDLEYEAT